MANKAQYRDRDVTQTEQLLVPLVETTKQRRDLRDQNYVEAHQDLEQTRAEYWIEPEHSLPMVMGGEDVIYGGDGTNFSGGVDLGYWEYWLEHFEEFRLMTGNIELVEGRDYPSEEQMESARSFAKMREQLSS